MSELEALLSRKYRFEIIPQEEGGFVGIYPELEGCLAQGETLEETLEELEDSRQLWIEVRYEDGLPIPEPAPEPVEPLPSGRLTLRLPRSLHGELVKRAEIQEVSLNQYVVSSLSRTSLESSISAELLAQVHSLGEVFRGHAPKEDLDSEALSSTRPSPHRPSPHRPSAWDITPGRCEAACFLFGQGEEGRRLAADLLAESSKERMSTFLLGLLYFMAGEPNEATPEAEQARERDLRTGWDHVLSAFRNGLTFREVSEVASSLPGRTLDSLWDRLARVVPLFAGESKNAKIAGVIE